MPIRIKPIQDLGPCVLNLSSLKGICKLVDANFNSAHYSAEDGVWEIYREDSTNFLATITEYDDVLGKQKHLTLDSFTVEASLLVEDKDKPVGIRIERTLEIVFDKNQSTVKFNGPPSLEDWFSHFMVDIRKNLESPTFRQMLNVSTVPSNFKPPFSIPIGSLVSGGLRLLKEKLIEASKAPYCLIILYKQPPNQMVENVKAGLVTNFIWVPLVFILGFLFALLAYWIWNKYGVNPYEWFSSPIIPTSTPLP